LSILSQQLLNGRRRENLGEIKPRILEGITTKIKASAKRRSQLRSLPFAHRCRSGFSGSRAGCESYFRKDPAFH
jgi:hypothetical protein